MKRLLLVLLLATSSAHAADAPIFSQTSPGGTVTMWNGSSFVPPLAALGAAARGANSDITSFSGLSGNISTAAGGVCDTSAWASYIGGTQEPQPSCFATVVAPTIAVEFPAVVGIGNATGGAVTAGDTTYEQHAQHLIQAQTSMDNTHQESGLVINMISKTGGGGLAQTNHNQKVGLYIPIVAVPGASNTWAINDDLTVNNGVGNYSFYRHEGDLTNFNGDYPIGGCNPCGTNQINANFFGDFLTFSGYPVTVGIDLTGNPNANSSSMHIGMFFQAVGGFTAVGTGLIDSATINDSSNSHYSFLVYGTHDVGLDTTNATVTYPLNMKQGQKVCFTNTDGCFAYVGTNALYYTQNGGTPLALIGTTSGVNGVSIASAGAGFGPTVKPVTTTTDTNLPLNLAGLGTGAVQALSGIVATNGISVTGGNVQFGTFVAATAGPTGYVSIVDAGGTVRHLAVVP